MTYKALGFLHEYILYIYTVREILKIYTFKSGLI